MGFKVSNNSVNISVNTFNNVGANNKNTFKLTSYDDIGEIDYSQYTPVQQNVDFAIAADNLRFERAQLADIYTWKDFTLDLIGFHEQVKNFWTRTASTVANLTVSLVEGLVSFGEAIVDCAALLVGVVATIGTGLWDIGAGIFTGNWDWSATGAMWKEGFMPFVGFDATSTAFDWVYEQTPVKQLNETAWDWGQRGGTAYSIGKGVGYYTGMIVVTFLTCGAAAPAVGATSASAAASSQVIGAVTLKTVAQGGVAFAGSLGKNTQKNYNAAVATAQAEGREVTGGEILGSIAKAGGSALIDGGTYFAAGAVGDTLKAAQSSLDLLKLDLGKTQLKAVEWGIKHKDALVIGTKATKAYVSEGYDCLWTGDNYDFGAATSDAVSIVVAEVVALKMKDMLYQAPKDSAPKVETSKVDISKTVEAASLNADLGNLADGLEGTKEAAAETLRSVSATEVFKFSIQNGLAKGEEKLVKEIVSTVVENVEIGGGN